ncbi:tail protein X [Stutzerimonas kunmingensis]|uniref:tail protein X n=1 Tax=Stutzerimonas kunmingensis TaxID=1211807 RepID=UPI0021061945|nr:tail protein X [Stutzerimonas kunmingensis]MCQ2035168.1 tail protein X [Stutzerimonas kunmingensis]
MASLRAQQGDTVDAICWRHYGRTAGVVEQVLDANPGLADLGPVIPHGTLIHLPEQAVRAEQRQVVNLWD